MRNLITALQKVHRFLRLTAAPTPAGAYDTHRDVYRTIRGKANYELSYAQCDRVLVLLAECDTCLADIPDDQLEKLVNFVVNESRNKA